MADVDPFAEFGAKADEADPFAEFGVKADASVATAPVAPVTPAPVPMSFGEKMTSLGQESAKAAGETLTDIGRGLISGAPFDLGPKAVAALESVGDKTYEEALADERARLAESKARSPYLFGGGELVSEFGTLRGVGKGAAAVGETVAKPFVAPLAKKTTQLAGESALMGLFGGTEAAARGEDVTTGALTTAALPGAGRLAGVASRALMPAAEAGLVEKAVRYPLAGAAAVSVPATLALESYPTHGTRAEKAKWLVTQGLVGRDIAKQGLGAAKGAAAKKLEPLQSRAAQEAEGLVRQKVYEPEAARLAEERVLEEPVAKMRREQAVRAQAEGEIGAYNQTEAARLRSIQEEAAGRQEAKRQADIDQLIVDETRKGDFRLRQTEEKKRNQQFRAALREEGRVIQTAANMERQGEATLRKLQAEAADLAALEQGLQEGTDPSLRGMLGKLFQDTSNRIMGAEEAVVRNPGKYAPEFVEKLRATRQLVDDSYIRNTERGGYLSDFVDDPYARLEAYRQDRLAQAQRSKDANAAAQEQVSSRLLADFEKEARAARAPVEIPEARIRALAEKAGLDYRRTKDLPKGRVDPEFGTEIIYPLKAAPSAAVAPESPAVALERKRAERPVTKAEMVETVRRERESRGEVPSAKPVKAEDRLRQLRLEQAEGRLGTATGETPKQVITRQLTEDRPAALEPAVQARMAQELAAARRTVGGLSPTNVQPGERPSGILEPSTGRILYETLVPEEVRPFVSLRRFMPGAGGGAVRVTEPKRSLPEYASVREGEIPTETRLERPLQLQALTDSWLRMLRTERDPQTAVQKFAHVLGKTVDEFVSTPSLALESLKLALQENEAAKAAKTREEESIRQYLGAPTP
jgi:hypothetical protein